MLLGFFNLDYVLNLLVAATLALMLVQLRWWTSFIFAILPVSYQGSSYHGETLTPFTDIGHWLNPDS